jgi:hypothetical protein
VNVGIYRVFWHRQSIEPDVHGQLQRIPQPMQIVAAESKEDVQYGLPPAPPGEVNMIQQIDQLHKQARLAEKPKPANVVTNKKSLAEQLTELNIPRVE